MIYIDTTTYIRVYIYIYIHGQTITTPRLTSLHMVL